MRPKLLTTANHDTMLNLGCDYGVCFLNTLEARTVKICGRVNRMCRKFGNPWVEYRDPIDLMDHPSNMEIGL